MQTVTGVLDGVRSQLAPDDPSLAALRTRRDCVRKAAESYEHVLRTYPCGGLAMGVANSPLTDADGGMVLNRQFHTRLGPDGDGALPLDIVESVQSYLGPKIRETYPNATVTKMKRGLIIRFGEKLNSGADPTVDLVIALNRRDAPGLWIPNMAQGRWDPANPECHLEMMKSGPQSMRTTRARVIRLAKAWNHSLASPAVCSFNLVALALAYFDAGGDLGVKTTEFFEYAAKSLGAALTDDPAGISGKISTPQGRDFAIKRLGAAAGHLRAALDAEGDDDKVLTELACVFPKHVIAPPNSKAGYAAGLRLGTGVSLGAASTQVRKPVRAYGSIR